MAWLFPNSWVSGNVPTASDFNNIAHDIRFWGGNIDAGANWLTNCAAVAGLGGTGALLLNPSGGNVGIGIASPQAILHAYQSVPNGLATPLILENTDPAGGTGNQQACLQFRLGRPSAYRYVNLKTVSAVDNYNNETGLAFEITTNNGVTISTTEVMRLLPVGATGYLGIGTTAPKSPLHVAGVPVYASDSAAGTGGLTTGAFWQDSSGVLHVKQ